MVLAWRRSAAISSTACCPLTGGPLCEFGIGAVMHRPCAESVRGVRLVDPRLCARLGHASFSDVFRCLWNLKTWSDGFLSPVVVLASAVAESSKDRP